jgi:hypothetical protein
LAVSGSRGQLLDTRTWQEIRSLDGDARFSLDGRVLVLHKDTSTLRLVDVDSGQEFCQLTTPHTAFHEVGFASDSWRLFTIDVFNGVSVWDLCELRQRLGERKLDWDAPAYPPPSVRSSPLRIEFDVGNFDEIRPRQFERNLDRAIEAAPHLPVRWWFRAKHQREVGRYAQAVADLRPIVQ